MAGAHFSFKFFKFHLALAGLVDGIARISTPFNGWRRQYFCSAL